MKKIAQLLMYLVCFFVVLDAKAVEYFTTSEEFIFSGNKEYAYLQNSIPSMLSSRIFKSGIVENPKERKTGILYTITGTITAIENTLSIDITVTGKNNIYHFPITTTTENLLQDINTVAITIQNKIIALSNTTPEVLSIKEKKKGFSPKDLSEWKESEDLPYTARSFIIDDLDNDGIAEIIILSDVSLHIYHLENNTLRELSQHIFYSRLEPISVSVANVESSLEKEILVTTLTDGRTPYSYIFSYKDSKMTVLLEGINALIDSYYDYITKTYYPLLQYVRAYPNPFFEMPLYSFSVINTKIQEGKRLAFPKEANPFNLTILKIEDEEKALILLPSERIAIYNISTQKEVFISKERYSGTSISLLLYPKKERNPDKVPSFKDWYYVPMKIALYPQDDKNLFLFINQPPELSATISFSSSYRSFNSTNIISLVVENNKLTKVWSSPALTASVEAVAVYDLDNNGVYELIALANIHKGFFNFKKSTSKLFYFSLTQNQKE